MEEEKKVEENVMENNNEVNQKNKKSPVLLIVIVILIVGAFIGGFLTKGMLSSEKENKEKEKSENVENNENKEDLGKDDNNTKTTGISVVEIDDNITKLYEKYHTNDSGNGVMLTNLVIEGKIYQADSFEVSSLQNKDITTTFGSKIYSFVKDELEKIEKKDELNRKYYEENEAEEIIKKGFSNMFSDILTFNHDTMNGCHTLSYQEGKYYVTPECGDVTDLRAYYKIAKAEKDENNIYIYEAVSVVAPAYGNVEAKVDLYIYKWTYNLKSDGNYYFTRAEKVR